MHFETPMTLSQYSNNPVCHKKEVNNKLDNFHFQSSIGCMRNLITLSLSSYFVFLTLTSCFWYDIPNTNCHQFKYGNQKQQNYISLRKLHLVVPDWAHFLLSSSCQVPTCFKLNFCLSISSFGSSNASFSGFSSSCLTKFEFWGLKLVEY